MTMLVTIEDFKARMRYTHDAEDADIELAIMAASEAVLNYLGLPHNAYDVPDSDSEMGSSSEGSSSDMGSSSEGYMDVPAAVQQAVLYLAGTFKRDPDGVEMADWEHGYLPKPVIALLYPLRDPAMG